MDQVEERSRPLVGELQVGRRIPDGHLTSSQLPLANARLSLSTSLAAWGGHREVDHHRDGRRADAYPSVAAAGETGPGLVLLHEIFGVSRYVRDRGRDLAVLGYVVCAPEVYWRLDDHDLDEDSPDALAGRSRCPSGSTGTPRSAIVQDTLSHLRGMIEVEGGVGLIGFCFGGGLAFRSPRSTTSMSWSVTTVRRSAI